MFTHSEFSNLVNRLIGNFLKAFIIQLKVLFNNSLEMMHSYRYYSNVFYVQCSLLFFFSYIFKNPYRICKEYLIQKEHENPYSYGETYASALYKITKECGLLSNDHFFELGCGRGKTLFWVNLFIRCKVTGIEQIPIFVKRCKNIIQLLKIKNIEVREEDILLSDLSHASVIYFYGTSFSDEFLFKFTKRCQYLKKGTRLISVSFPLQDYCDKPLFQTIKQFQVKYPWGKAEVYLQIKS